LVSDHVRLPSTASMDALPCWCLLGHIMTRAGERFLAPTTSRSPALCKSLPSVASLSALLCATFWIPGTISLETPAMDGSTLAGTCSQSRRKQKLQNLAVELCHSVSRIQYQSYTPGHTTASLSEAHKINRAPTKNNDSVTLQKRSYDYNCRLS
jgi:hypothetical protein